MQRFPFFKTAFFCRVAAAVTFWCWPPHIIYTKVTRCFLCHFSLCGWINNGKLICFQVRHINTKIWMRGRFFESAHACCCYLFWRVQFGPMQTRIYDSIFCSMLTFSFPHHHAIFTSDAKIVAMQNDSFWSNKLEINFPGSTTESRGVLVLY